MRLYPDVPRRRLSAAVYDLLLVVLIAALAAIAWRVHEAVNQLAVLGEGVRKAGGAVPFGIGNPVEDLGQRGEDSVHHLANVLAAITFGIPAVVVIWHFVPRRVAQVRRLNLAARALEGAPTRELAMRAAFALPYERLLAYTRDPLGDLAAERFEPLVAAVLDDAGLKRSAVRARPPDDY
jgi:hypothetical protein